MEPLLSLGRRYGFYALILLISIESGLETAFRQDALHRPDTSLWFAVPAVAVLPLPLLAYRRFPFVAPAAIWPLAAALSFVDGHLPTLAVSTFLGAMAASFLLGNQLDDFQARVGLAIVLVGAAIVVSSAPDTQGADYVFIPALFAITWLGGFALRERAAQADAAEERAAQAERERESAARLAVAEERTRIARELHDIVAHSVSVMVLQVGAVRHKLPDSLADDRDALQDVERAGREALTEMRRLLGAMRRDTDDLEMAPQPGLAELEALVQHVGRAGLPARLHIEGKPSVLPQAVHLSVYRIAQEGLTNALKHAQATEAIVTVRHRSDEVEIEVRDNGTGMVGNGRSGGHGLVGINERVKIYGGSLLTGNVPGGGFVLTARLPLDGMPR